MAHTHTGPSHTHGVGTLATTSAGTHWHQLEMSTHTGNVDGTLRNCYYNRYDSSRLFLDTTGPKATNSGAHTHTISGSTAAAGTGNTGASSATNTGSTGKAIAFNNMPKSIAIPLWTRIS